jgi:phage repressor protein C with HTH and peptisase S24 domain
MKSIPQTKECFPISVPDLHDPDAFASRNTGDSMAPEFLDGDVIAFSPAAVIRDHDACYVELVGGKRLFRYIWREKDSVGNPVVRLTPGNPRFDWEIVAESAIVAMTRAVKLWRSVENPARRGGGQ